MSKIFIPSQITNSFLIYVAETRDNGLVENVDHYMI